MVRESNLHFVAWIEMDGVALFVHGVGNDFRQPIYSVRNVRAYVEHLVASRGNVNRFSDHWRHIADMCKGPLLLPITKDRHGLALHELIHEDTYDIAITITDVLTLTVHVMGPKNHIVQAKHLVANLQISFDGEFRNAVRVFRLRHHLFAHRRLPCTVNRNGRSEYKAADAVVYGRINQIYRADQIIVVVKALDEMTEPFRGVGSQMVHVCKAMPVEEPINQFGIKVRSFYKRRAAWHIVFKPAAQVIENDNFVPPAEKFVSNMRSDEAGTSCH